MDYRLQSLNNVFVEIWIFYSVWSRYLFQKLKKMRLSVSAIVPQVGSQNNHFSLKIKTMQFLAKIKWQVNFSFLDSRL